MAALSLICGLFGCKKASKRAEHELSEITSVSISCGHMDRRCGYSFQMLKKENGWLLNAECFTNNHETETAIENRELDDDDAKALLEILKRNESIAYAENYKKPKKRFVQVADETTYGFCLTFSDGSFYATYDRQSDLEQLFYRLAEKYGKKS